MNPIEQVFAKLKTLLRKAAACARESLWHTVGSLFTDFPAAECANCGCRCGYGRSG